MNPLERASATFGGGCFWCLEAVFEQLEGVDQVVSGYAGGHTDNPDYHLVCSGRTGHAEVIQVVFDPKVRGYRDLLEVFMASHDPTTLNRQGADVGTQYRSIILYHDLGQKEITEKLIAELGAAKVWPDPIVTEVVPLVRFYPAEDYHQGYFRSNPHQPYCQVVVAPKVAAFRRRFAARLKS